MHRTLLLSLCLICCVAASTEFTHPNVEHLTASNFAEKTADGRLWFIKFYAPWCGHCKKLAPTWGDLGKSFESNKYVAIAHIDCTAAKETCQTADVKGYPTLKLYFDGQMHKKFSGTRSIDDLKKFVEDGVTELFAETTS